VREDRNLMIGRVKHLECYGLATELEPGRWTVSDRPEVTRARSIVRWHTLSCANRTAGFISRWTVATIEIAIGLSSAF
jgi:hypothetical protein